MQRESNKGSFSFVVIENACNKILSQKISLAIQYITFISMRLILNRFLFSISKWPFKHCRIVINSNELQAIAYKDLHLQITNQN